MKPPGLIRTTAGPVPHSVCAISLFLNSYPARAPDGPEPPEPREPAEPPPGKPGKPTPSQQAMDILKETVPLLTFPETHPAWPWRSHAEDAGYVDPATLQMIACDATISTMFHDDDGEVLNAGRRTRKPPGRLRRAVRERDRYRCRFPGCESRRTDVHHVRFWANRGETSLDNCCSLCKVHHRLVHTGRVMIARTGSGFSFYLAKRHPDSQRVAPGGRVRRRDPRLPRRGGRLPHHRPVALWRAPRSSRSHLGLPQQPADPRSTTRGRSRTATTRTGTRGHAGGVTGTTEQPQCAQLVNPRTPVRNHCPQAPGSRSPDKTQAPGEAEDTTGRSAEAWS
jgi:hypothetical protein